METKIDSCLKMVKKWAESKVSTGQEPPWAWYQYMKLIETVVTIQKGRAAVTPISANSPRGESRQRASRPKEGGVVRLDKPRRRRRNDDPPLPM